MRGSLRFSTRGSPRGAQTTRGTPEAHACTDGMDYGVAGSKCEVRSRCHLISEQVSLGYEVSLQFALAPLGGGLLKQRDRLGAGRARQRRGGSGGREGERERERDGGR